MSLIKMTKYEIRNAKFQYIITFLCVNSDQKKANSREKSVKKEDKCME